MSTTDVRSSSPHVLFLREGHLPRVYAEEHLLLADADPVKVHAVLAHLEGAADQRALLALTCVPAGQRLPSGRPVGWIDERGTRTLLELPAELPWWACPPPDLTPADSEPTAMMAETAWTPPTPTRFTPGDWELVYRVGLGGHRYYRYPTVAAAGAREAISVADHSGTWPHDTDDGVLWLDHNRRVCASGGSRVCWIPVLTAAGQRREIRESPPQLWEIAAMFGLGLDIHGVLLDPADDVAENAPAHYMVNQLLLTGQRPAVGDLVRVAGRRYRASAVSSGPSPAPQV